VLPSCPASPSPTTAADTASLLAPESALLGTTAPLTALTPTELQTILGLFGPYLVSLGDAFVASDPSLAPLIEQVVSLDGNVTTSLLSLTGLVPDQLLAAETALAKAVVPVVVATSCVASVVGVLTTAG
jgi:hypothetical protein